MSSSNIKEGLKTILRRVIKQYIEYFPVEIHLDEAPERRLWYCNVSGYVIDQLQEYNAASPKKIAFIDLDDNGLKLISKLEGDISADLIKEGFNSYRVYPCGHAFYDVLIFSKLFDTCSFEIQRELFFKFEKEPNDIEIPNKLISLINKMGDCLRKCPCCDNRKNPSLLYTIFENLADVCLMTPTQTVYIRNHLPAGILPLIADLYHFGDIIDTEGYRGTGLWIKNETTFEKVTRNEYYPCWELKYLKERGYGYYLNHETYKGYYESIEFENGVEFWPWSEHFIIKVENTNDNKVYISRKQSELYHIQSLIIKFLEEHKRELKELIDLVKKSDRWTKGFKVETISGEIDRIIEAGFIVRDNQGFIKLKKVDWSIHKINSDGWYDLPYPFQHHLVAYAERKCYFKITDSEYLYIVNKDDLRIGKTFETSVKL